MIYKELPSADYLRSIFDYDKISGKLFWKIQLIKKREKREIGDVAGIRRKSGYVVVVINGQSFYAHRLIWKMVKGNIPNNKQIDHEDRIRFHNAWHNLILKSASENRKNSSLPCNNSSGIIGVSFHSQSGLWVGSISNNKKRETKYFKTKEEAINWRKEKEDLYGFHKNHGKNITF